MAPSKLVTTSVGFQDAKGTVVANGALTLTLSQSAEIIATGGLVDTAPIYLPLDVNGKITSTAIWFNDELTPSGTTYHAVLYGSNLSQILADFGQWSIAGASADLSTMVPTTTGASYAGAVLLSPSGNQIVSQPSLSSFYVNRFENVRYADQFSGSDIGAQINAAYADLPTGGGKIIVAPKADGTKYDFSTPIVFGVSGKFVLLEGMSPGGNASGGCFLNYTPTTATTAIAMDYMNTGAQGPVHGLRNIQLVNNNSFVTGGQGSSAVGISNGTTNTGCTGAIFDNVGVNGFGVGFSETNTTQGYTASNIVWINPQFIANTVAMKVHVASGVILHGGTIGGNGSGIVGKTSTSTAELALFGTQFFGNTGLDFDFTAGNISNGVSILNLHAVHIERDSGNSPHSMDGVFDLRMRDGLIEDVNSVGTTDRFINTGGSNYLIEGTLVTSGRTTTTVLVANSPSRGKIEVYASSTNISTLVTGANASKFTTLVRYPGTVAANPQTNESVQLGPNGATAGPTYSFTNFTNSGIHSGGNGNTTISSGGVDTACFGAGTAGVQIATGGAFNWASGALNGALDTAIARSAAGVVAIGTTGGGAIDGSLVLKQVTEQTANGAQWVHGQNSENLTLSTSGTTTDTAANLLPANSIIEAVVARVTTTITVATDWKLGDSVQAARFTAADSVMTAGETKVGLNQADPTVASANLGPVQSSAAKVRVTTTGTPGAGAIRITVFYRQFVAPAS